MQELVDAVETREVHLGEVADYFEYSYRSWGLKKAIDEEPSLRTFMGSVQMKPSGNSFCRRSIRKALLRISCSSGALRVHGSCRGLGAGLKNGCDS